MQRTLPAHDQPAAIVHPGERPLHYPAGLVQLSRLDRTSTFWFLPLTPLKGRNSRFDASPAQFTSKSTTIVGLVSRQRLRPGAWATLFLGHTNGLQRRIRQGDFMWLSAVQMQTNGQTMAIYHQHHLAALANFGLAYSGAPLFAGTKLPSRKACAHSSLPWASNLPSSVRQMSSQVPSSDHWLSRRQQVVDEPYSAGMSCHAQPVLRTYRMPLSVRRSSALGRPGPDFCLGISGSITAHCSSVRSCLLPMR